MGRVVSPDELLVLREKFRGRGQKVVFTNGVFDLLHRGHLELLNQAKNLGDVLVVGINSDASARRNKGPNRPIISQEDRAFMLCNLVPVDFVVIFDEDTPYQLIAALKPDVLVKGADYKISEIVGSDIVLAYGGKVVPIALVRDRSSTRIINSILKRYTENSKE